MASCLETQRKCWARESRAVKACKCRVRQYADYWNLIIPTPLPSHLLAGAGIWQSRQLFVSTNTSVHAVFADPVEQFVQVGGAGHGAACAG